MEKNKLNDRPAKNHRSNPEEGPVSFEGEMTAMKYGHYCLKAF